MTDESIFVAALAISDSTKRAAYLDRACADNPDLRRQVEELLAAHAGSHVLDRPPAGLARTSAHVPTSEDAESLASVGDRIGAYKLLEKIGEGGMGQVWVADQQEPIKRRVALKLIKPGMDSRGVLARFEAERQALAVMDHPNIAKVLDAGTTPEGRPYFVMELVKGTPITTFCDASRLPTRKRLELFAAVCQAIQHAHQKGVIHRDIKPSNVLVALYDDNPVPKVIDFGIAKAAGNPLTERTLHTGFGAMLGTPEYMSPEQATFNQLDIDTRSDVYSLGVLLYELLTGTTPVDKSRFKEAALLEILRVVREEDPPRPSMKLSTSQARASIAAVRGAAPDKLAKELRGELDWIVMKSLEKDRNRRYESAAGLGRDVERYLKDELVEARPPSAWYRMRKFLRKNRPAAIGLGVAALFLLTLGLGVIGLGVALRQARDAETSATWAKDEADNQRRRAETSAEHARQLFKRAVDAESSAVNEMIKARDERLKAERERKRAEQNEKEAMAVLSFLNDKVLSAARPKGIDGGLGKGISLQQAIEAAEGELPIRFKNQPHIEASIRHSLGLTYAALDDAKPAISQFHKALKLYRSKGPADAPAALKVLEDLGHQYWIAGKLRDAERLMNEAVSLRRKNLTSKNWEELGQGLLTLSVLYNSQQKPVEAILLMQEVVDLAKKHDAMREPLALTILYGLGEGYAQTKRYAEAADARREFVELRRPKTPGPAAEPVDPDNDLDRKFMNLALAMEKLFAPTEASLVEDLEDLGPFLLRVEHPKEAENALREALALREKKWPDTWQRFETMTWLGTVLATQKKNAEAEPLLEKGYSEMMKRKAAIDPFSLYRLDAAGERLAKFYESVGRAPEAAKIRQEAEKRKAVKKS